MYRALALSFGDADLAHEATSEAMARCYQRWGRIQATTTRRGGSTGSASTGAGPASPGAVVTPTAPTGSSGPARLPRPRSVAGDPELDAALRSLDLKYRSVVVLRYLCDWSEAETAEALHAPRRHRQEPPLPWPRSAPAATGGVMNADLDSRLRSALRAAADELPHPTSIPPARSAGAGHGRTGPASGRGWPVW